MAPNPSPDRWLGDLDGDGYDDLMVRADGGEWYTWLIYGGNASLVDAGDELDMFDFADAYVEASGDTRATFPGGDFDGDGNLDLFMASDDRDEQLGILFGTGTRYSGSISDWGTGQFWTATYSDEYWMGTAPDGDHWRLPFGADVTGDGADDILWEDGVIEGGAALSVGGRLADALSWTFASDVTVTRTDSSTEIEAFGFAAQPAGDLDGDGIGDVVMKGGKTSDAVSWGWRTPETSFYHLVSIADLPPCDYVVEDAAWASLTLDEGGYEGDETYEAYDPREATAASDLNGDGANDLIVAQGNVVWFLYGGEGWLIHGGGLEGAADRIEVPIGIIDSVYTGDLSVQDLDGDGMTDVAIGGSYRDGDDGDRAHLDILQGSAAGQRGVQPYQDAFDVSVVVGPSGVDAFSQLGRGDLDADGLDDLMISWSTTYYIYDSNGDVYDSFPGASASLLYGSELLPYLE